jgi:hypothetical protein
MPLGVVITGANANDGVQAGDVLEAMVIRPPEPGHPSAEVDERSLPTAQDDGSSAMGRLGSGPRRRAST